jgi:uncharacterized protein (DUF2336 family)
MSVSPSLIPELEDVVEHSSPERRAQALQRITAYFVDGASRFNEEHVRIFDEVFSCLIAEIETKARAELAAHIAPVPNAPVGVVRTLAQDDDITVAGPVLSQSPRLADRDLLDIAQSKGQAHLLAIAGRPEIAEPITDVLVQRGDHEVARSVAQNRGARISENGFNALVARAQSDGALAETVGLRPDIPPRLFRDLLLKATEVVQQRLFASAKPETQAEIRRVLAKVSTEMAARAAPRDYSTAQRLVEELRAVGKLDEAALIDFANAGKYEETVAALSVLCAVPIEVVDRLMGGDRPDPVLILCKSAGWGWPTAKAIIQCRPNGKGVSSGLLDNAFSNFERLSPATAQRVMRFWQVRRGDES